jgi:hypothetical protein
MRAFLLGTAVLALAGACGGTDSNDPNDPIDPTDPVDPTDPTDPTDPPTPDESAKDNDELATILAAHIRAEFPLQLAVAELSKNVYPEGFSQTSSTLEETLGVGALGGLTIDFAYHCNDGTPEHPLVPCDGLAHHSHIRLDISGSQSMGAIAMDGISRVVDWEIRDLTVGKARFRGPDALSLHTSATTDGVLADYIVKFNATYEQVRFLSGQLIPTFGTVDFTINTERLRADDRRVFNSTARLTFASGGATTLVLDGSVTYSLDLVAGTVTKL